jgi:hypothetical protein
MIDVIPRTSRISQPPYEMGPKELVEFKSKKIDESRRKDL